MTEHGGFFAISRSGTFNQVVENLKLEHPDQPLVTVDLVSGLRSVALLPCGVEFESREDWDLLRWRLIAFSRDCGVEWASVDWGGDLDLPPALKANGHGVRWIDQSPREVLDAMGRRLGLDALAVELDELLKERSTPIADKEA